MKLISLILLSGLSALGITRHRVVDEDGVSQNLGLLVELKRPKTPLSTLDFLRPPMCLDESLTTMFGEHYNLVHPKSADLGGRCRFSDFGLTDIRLGQGGYGVVSEAVHGPTGKKVALKSIIEMNPAWHKWIRAEECIQYGLDFPFITKLHCSMAHDWYTWLVLELVEGQTLRKKLQSPDSNLNIKKIAAQLMVTIEYLHLNQIVFGDLTSSNIMIDGKSGDVKVIDFGFALRRNPSKEDTIPSWDNGKTLPDFGTNFFNDWYAFGFLIYEMVVASRKEPSGLKGRYENPAWIGADKLAKVKICAVAVDDPIACDLIQHFLINDFSQGAKWTDSWGLNQETRKLIKGHGWFEGFDWQALENQVANKLVLNPYNRFQ
jgi:hypothetical protein